MALAWNWLCLPYVVCTLALAAVGVAAVVVRGDRVLRLGTIGTATTALPWAVCSALAACTSDPALATRLHRLGAGSIALVGPSLLLVLLGVSGQLERRRWLAWTAGTIGTISLVLCWATDLVVPGVHPLSSGIFYVSAGPLTAAHFIQLGLWLLVGLLIARRSAQTGPSTSARRRMVYTLVGVLGLGTVGASDLLLVYGWTGGYPIAWLPATLAALVALYAELRTDLLRPQGFDRGAFYELAAFVASTAVIGAITLAFQGTAPVALATLAALAWIVGTGIAWTLVRDRPIPIARERALVELSGSLADVVDERVIAERLVTLWRAAQIEIRAIWRVQDDHLVAIGGDAQRPLDPALARWLVERVDVVAAGDLGTMKLGELRARVEALLAQSGTTLVVPLVDRGTLVGLVDADHVDALREDETGFVIQSARTIARALTYAALAAAAAREGETAREVEVAEAMRLQASASRDDELGPWHVAAEYRTAPRTTGAGWSTSLLPDGRLALLVMEAQAHGVAAALATSTLTGAFVAATTSARSIGLEDLLAWLRATAEGPLRGGEPVAAFVALIDATTERVEWASVNHPGAAIVDRTGVRFADAPRSSAPFGADALLVVASASTRGADDARFREQLESSAPAGTRLARFLVDERARSGSVTEDLLAVVIRRSRHA